MRNILAFFCLGSALYIFISLISYTALDPSLSSVSSLSDSVKNLGGPFGAYLSDALFSAAGIGAYLLLLVLSFVAVKSLFFYRRTDRVHKTIKFISVIVLLSSFSALCEFYYSGDYFPQSSSGGLIGALVFTNLSNIFGVVGSLIFIVIFFLASISLTFSFSWLFVIDSIGKGVTYLFLELSAQLTRLTKLIFNSIKSIDLSKLRTNNELIVNKSVVDAKPRELNLSKLSPAVAHSVTKTDITKTESTTTSTAFKSKDKNTPNTPVINKNNQK